MPALSDYTAGTITLTNGSVNFTGSGTGWQAADFREGDTILGIEDHAGVEYVIASITGNGTGTLTQEWEGATGTYAYRMRYMADGARVTAQARNLIELLGNGNLQALAGLTGPGVPVFNGPHAMEIKPVTDFVNGVAYNVQVDTIADRAAYDGQSEGFAVLVSDMGDDRSALFSKASNTPGDWTDPAYITGPVGPMPDVEATVDTLPPGSAATVTPTPITGGVRLDFELPEASGFYNAGVYDIAEAYSQDDVVRHNGSSFIALQAVPAGTSPSNASPPTDTAYWQVLAAKGQDGNITGVTPFWQGRITVDADASAGRTGLKAVGYEAQSLTSAEQGRARANIGAKPSYNHIDNPEFRYSQRGDAFTSPGYGPDAWRVTWSAGDTAVFQTLPLSNADADGGFVGAERIALRVQFIGTAGEKSIIQRKRGVGAFANKRVTLAFWINQQSGAEIDLNPIVVRNFGSGGSPVELITFPVQKIPTTAWTLYLQTMEIPPLTGKTIGAGNYLETYFLRGTNMAGFVYLGRTGLFEGDWTASADPFPAYSASEDLTRCQRRFYRPNPGTGAVIFSGSATGPGQVIDFRYDFPTTMDVSPTITQEGAWSETNVTSTSFAAAVSAQGFRGTLIATAAGRTFIYNENPGVTFNASAEP